MNGAVTGIRVVPAKHFDVAAGLWTTPAQSGSIHITRLVARVHYVVYRADGLLADQTTYTFADESAAKTFFEELKRDWPTPAPMPVRMPLERYPHTACVFDELWMPPFEKLKDVSMHKLFVVEGGRL